MKQIASSESSQNNPVVNVGKITNTGTKPQVDIAIGENGDMQYTSTGDALVDLVARGVDSFIEKKDRSLVERFVGMVKAAWEQDPDMTQKIARYFRDRSKGQGMKEQPMLLIALLNDYLSVDEIKSILLVHSKDAQKDGSVREDNIDFLDLVRILAWHHYLYGKQTKISLALSKVMAGAIANNKEPLAQILRYKNRNLAYDENNKMQVGIIDIVGIVRNMKNPRLPADVIEEYELHLAPRHRRGVFNAKPVSELAKKQRAFFKNELPDGEVPEGVTFEKVLSRGKPLEIRQMVLSNRISTTQVKVNLNTLLECLEPDEFAKLIEKHNFNLMPHEILAMGKAFYIGTEHTNKSAKGVSFVDTILNKTIDKYKKVVKKRVLALGDTSGSMSVRLSEKSSIEQGEFAYFVSYLTSHISGTRVFGTFDSTARLYKAGDPSVEDFIAANRASDCGTDIVKAVRTVGEHFKNRQDAPEVICIISDMQFNASAFSPSMSEAKRIYKGLTGIDVELIYWNIQANTLPSVSQDGVLYMSGFSANSIEIVLGLVNETVSVSEEKQVTRKVNPQDLLKWIDTYYQ
jgi:hypothetical protein